LSNWIYDLDRKVRKQETNFPNWDYYQFLVRATCPPTASIFISQGRAAFTPRSTSGGVHYFIKAATINITDEDAAVIFWPYTCINAGWYVPIYVVLNWLDIDDDVDESGFITPTLRFFGAEYESYLGGGFVEYETSSAAEAAIDAQNPEAVQDHIGESGLPLCRLILRISTPGDNQFMEIDAVNRERSYLWGQFRNQRYMM